jgi:glycosyltransferase involved in cell wall biosynthesis
MGFVERCCRPGPNPRDLACCVPIPMPLPEPSPRQPSGNGAIHPLIVIPTYDNVASLRGVVEQALGTGIDVLVVDDGSTDGSAATIEDSAAHCIGWPVNRGKGAAILAAAKWADEHGFSHIITVDADGQHDATEAPRLLEPLGAHPMTIVIGHRTFDSETVPRSSRFGRSWSNLWIRISAGVTVGDSQSGFRAYPVAALREIGFTGKRYNFEIEVLVRGVWAGLRIASVPVSVRYDASTREASHFRPFVDNARISWTYTRLVTRNFFPWPHLRRFNRVGDEFHPSFSHPIESLKELHRRVFGRPAHAERLSIRHPLRSIKLLHVERTTPRQVALATMLGIFLGALPLLFVHTVVIIFCAGRLRLNRAIAFYASNLCAPVVPPFVPALSIEAGHYMRFGRFLLPADLNTKAELFQTLGREAHLRLWEWFLGSLVVGPLLAVVVGGLAYGAARVYQKRRLRHS